MADNITIIDSRSGRKDGLNKCLNCGSTEIFTLPESGQLQCQQCRTIFFPPPKATAEQRKSTQEVRYSGASDIDPHAGALVTIKCQGCGAEVVLNTNDSMHTRCHWCRQILSLENQTPNGTVPDVLLPFHLSKEQARASIEEFVKKRTFFAKKRFKKEFTTENILGVYFPYFIVDTNAHCAFKGNAGEVVNRYTKLFQGEKNFYDIDVYDITRSFDIEISGLTVEAHDERQNSLASETPNNIINSIMPFDIEKAIPYNGNYMKGFTSDKRNINVAETQSVVDSQIEDIACRHARLEAEKYDAGIVWNEKDVEKEGIVWRTAYLPVWLYSYLEQAKSGKQALHYAAVNARTGETMASVPLNKRRLLFFSLLIAAIVFIPFGLLVAWCFIAATQAEVLESLLWYVGAGFFGVVVLIVTVALGCAFYGVKKTRYRNKLERHYHEEETAYDIKNLQKTDTFLKHEKDRSARRISELDRKESPKEFARMLNDIATGDIAGERVNTKSKQ